jgi:GNAT superfamily N-acetyltransferase
LAKELTIRMARVQDAPKLRALLLEWLKSEPRAGRLRSIRRAIRNREFLVAQIQSNDIGFIHYILHEDVIDGALNAFITAFYVSPAYRGKGVGSSLLRQAITDSIARGAVGVETSTIHDSARKLYEKHHFKQASGDIGEVFLELDVDAFSSPLMTHPKPHS